MRIKLSLYAVALLSLTSCEVLNVIAPIVLAPTTTETNKPAPLTNDEAVAGLKEALSVGITNAVNLTSVTDGFLGNPEIKIPFPESALKIKEKAESWGLGSQVDKIVETLNRSAEDASLEAKPIFINAIKNMTITDGFSILTGGEGAATAFLKKNTTSELVAAFSPKVETSINKVKLTEYWNPVATRYNQAMLFTGGDKIETNLTNYVTEKAVDGLFLMVEKEENLIRKDPVARVTAILAKVFGSI